MKTKALLLVFLSCFGTYAISAQTKNDETKKRNNDDYLPGKPYGLGFTIPPLPTSEEPPATTVNIVTSELAISLTSSLPRELACKNYYMMDVKVKITVPEGKNKVMVNYKIDGTHDGVSLSQFGLVEGNQQYTVAVDPGTTKTIPISLKLLYPYVLSNVNGKWETIFKQTRTSLTARIVAASLLESIPRVIFIIEDPVPGNNTSTNYHISPKLKSCQNNPNETN